MGAVGLLLLLLLLVLFVVLLVLSSLVRIRVSGIRLGRRLLLGVGLGLLLRGVSGGLLLLLLLGIDIGLLLLRGVGCGGCLLLVGRVGLLVGRVHLRLVLLVGVLRLGRRVRGVLGGQHRGALRLHLDGGVVDRGLLVLLMPEAVGVAVEDEGGDEQEPGEVSVAQAF